VAGCPTSAVLASFSVGAARYMPPCILMSRWVTGQSVLWLPARAALHTPAFQSSQLPLTRARCSGYVLLFSAALLIVQFDDVSHVRAPPQRCSSPCGPAICRGAATHTL
jgi:hypothetical protein